MHGYKYLGKKGLPIDRIINLFIAKKGNLIPFYKKTYTFQTLTSALIPRVETVSPVSMWRGPIPVAVCPGGAARTVQKVRHRVFVIQNKMIFSFVPISFAI